jgi:hypothetical protein
VVGPGAELREVTLGDEAVVPESGRPEPGTRVECGVEWEPA